MYANSNAPLHMMTFLICCAIARLQAEPSQGETVVKISGVLVLQQSGHVRDGRRDPERWINEWSLNIMSNGVRSEKVIRPRPGSMAVAFKFLEGKTVQVFGRLTPDGGEMFVSGFRARLPDGTVTENADEVIAKQSPGHRLLEAIKLTGRIDAFAIRGDDNENLKLEEIENATRDIITLLEAEGFKYDTAANVLTGSVKKLKKVGPKVKFILKTTMRPTVAEISGIAGAENGRSRSKLSDTTVGPFKEIPIEWYEYGWCHFGAVDGAIVALRIDCAKF